MITKGIREESFGDYSKPSMYISFSSCSFKCDKECGRAVCQNSLLVKEPNISIEDKVILEKYLQNPITKAFVFGGLEPFEDVVELFNLIDTIRAETSDDIVIYTGYRENEIAALVAVLERIHKNIIIKFGRFVPDQKAHLDSVLGVNLSSPNQYAKKIS